MSSPIKKQVLLMYSNGASVIKKKITRKEIEKAVEKFLKINTDYKVEWRECEEQNDFYFYLSNNQFSYRMIFIFNNFTSTYLCRTGYNDFAKNFFLDFFNKNIDI